MSRVEIQGLSKGYGGVHAIRDVSLVVEPGEIVALLGPSGCGKSTTLRCVAGLDRADHGIVKIGGRVVSSESKWEPPEKRNVGLVFQSYALWPHMSCYDNVALGLKAQRVPRPEIVRRVGEALQLLGLEELGARYPSQLSGGQQQRVAVARSIAAEPKVLLFDEPLSNLDAQIREVVRRDLHKLLKRLHITTIYVTHDRIEALAIADRVAVMNFGRIEQVGAPRSIYERPASPFVADFLGWANLVAVSYSHLDPISGFGAYLSSEGELIQVAGPPIARSGWVAFRARGGTLIADRVGVANAWPIKIESQVYLGDYLELQASFGGATIRILSEGPVVDSSTVSFHLPAERIRFFAAEESMMDG